MLEGPNMLFELLYPRDVVVVLRVDSLTHKPAPPPLPQPLPPR